MVSSSRDIVCLRAQVWRKMPQEQGHSSRSGHSSIAAGGRYPANGL